MGYRKLQVRADGNGEVFLCRNLRSIGGLRSRTPRELAFPPRLGCLSTVGGVTFLVAHDAARLTRDLGVAMAVARAPR